LYKKNQVSFSSAVVSLVFVMLLTNVSPDATKVFNKREKNSI